MSLEERARHIESQVFHLSTMGEPKMATSVILTELQAVAAEEREKYKPPREPRPDQQTCKVCLRPDKFDFHVPHEVWEAVVPPEFRNRVVCLACFDDFAAEGQVDYSAYIGTDADPLYFAGDAATFRFKAITAIPANDYPTSDKP